MELYNLWESETEQSDNSKFMLHSHDEYEIFMFLEGDSKYIVEDKVYNLEKGDIIIIRKHEMHRIFHNSSVNYRRFVMMISPEFFREYGCMEYEESFLRSSADKGNKISGDAVRSSGLYDAILRMKKYSDGFKVKESPVMAGVVVETMYIINKLVSFSEADAAENPTLKAVISFINDNYTQEITLDMLAERFFVSKYHLCRIFREATGHTVQGYIRNKRLIRARELVQSGKNMTEAAMLAGFNSYSSFYRAYKNESGQGKL